MPSVVEYSTKTDCPLGVSSVTSNEASTVSKSGPSETVTSSIETCGCASLSSTMVPNTDVVADPAADDL